MLSLLIVDTPKLLKVINMFPMLGAENGMTPGLVDI